MSFLRKGLELKVLLKSNLCFLLIYLTESQLLFILTEVVQYYNAVLHKEKIHIFKGGEKSLQW